LKVFDDIKLKDDAVSKLSGKSLPDVVIIDAEEFKKRVSEHKTHLQRKNRIKRLYNNPVK
jgi:hypothetical protein